MTGFRRPDLLQNLMQYLLQLTDPSNIFLSVDGSEGAKASHHNAIEACRVLARNYQAQGVNVHLPEVNLGCYMGNRSAITWFFVNVDSGIILEDDMWPSESFLNYCTAALTEFDGDPKIGSISGTNIVPIDVLAHTHSVGDFRLSRYSSSWGWATWADRWERFVAVADDDEIYRVSKRVFRSGMPMRYWNQLMLKTYHNQVDSWAYRWLFTHWANGWYALTPNVNLVKNLGFGSLATHTTETVTPWWVQDVSSLPNRGDVSKELRESKILPNVQADVWLERHHFRIWKNYLRIWLLDGRLGWIVNTFDRARGNL